MHLPASTYKLVVAVAVSGMVLATGAGATAQRNAADGQQSAGTGPADGAWATAAGFHPGAPGVGDPYFPNEGNGGYDVQHYNLRLSYDPATHRLAGSNTITAVATQNLSSFDLDLTGFVVSGVYVDGKAAGFARKGQELRVTPPQGLTRNDPFQVKVSYAGKPKTIVGSPIVFGSPYGWIYTKDGAFVGCEPNGAHTWFPSNDHPSDKAGYTFHITVPKDRKVVANGSLVSQTVSGDAATFVWNERQPMATYLATIDIGTWDFHSTRTAGGIPEFVAIDPSLAGEALRHHIVALFGRITDYWTKLFGRYAFGSTGGIVDNVRDIGFSLETQTRPLYGFVPDPVTASHELAHQWFGDSVSVATWNDIWLNEGFATYSMWRWEEHDGGPTTWQTARSTYDAIGANSKFWQLQVADPGRNQMFHSPIYYRGGMALAVLRHKIGDAAFTRLLRDWARQHRFANATTQEFVELADKVSGRDLTPFFHRWLWEQAKPPLK